MDQAPSERTRVKRLNKRAKYDMATVHAILDATPHCSVGYVIDGLPYVTPTLHWREGSHVYWHGSSASRMLEACENAEVCLSVYLVDGYVIARSAFNHSCNYRSVMAFGRAFKVTDMTEKEERLRTFTERLFPGRWSLLRPPTVQEIKATTVLGLALEEVSAKVRSGPPGDEEEDYGLPIWAGVLPVRRDVLPPQDDPRLIAGLLPPDHVRDFTAG
jgi:nitroimidazol reductase NimA-like FMN-containing flavoprotein (pyridoxamine 5'-phosphate oxidase superfamily)